MGWRGVQVYGLGVLWKALSRHPRQVQKAWKHPTSTIQVNIFWGKLCSNLSWSIRWKANTWRSLLQQSSGLCMWRSSTEDIRPWDEWRTIAKGQGRHRIQEGSTSRGCKIGRLRVEALWWTHQRSDRIVFGRRVYWQKSWKCWVIIEGMDSPSLEPWNLETLRELASLRSSTRKRSVTRKTTNKAPAHDKQTNMRFLQMVRSSEAHVILICQAGSLKPYETYLEEFGWTMMLKIFLSLAWLRQEGSIQQIAGPRGHDPSNNFSGPKRRGSMQSLRASGGMWYEGTSLLHPPRHSFLHKTWRLWHVQGWLQQELLVIMSTVKMQASHMQSWEHVLPLCSLNAVSVR